MNRSFMLSKVALMAVMEGGAWEQGLTYDVSGTVPGPLSDCINLFYASSLEIQCFQTKSIHCRNE